MATVKCYTFTFDPLQERFDMTQLDEELGSGMGQIVYAQLFHFDGLPRLTILVQGCTATKGGAISKVDYRSMLRASERPLFDRLKQWRSHTARDQSVPAHRVASNRVLASIAALRPGSISTMLQVPGVGPRTVSRYGTELLRIINTEDALPTELRTTIP